MGLLHYNTPDAVRILKSGGVLLLATDTLPGLHCRADDEAAVRRVFELKGRDSRQPLLVLAGSLAQALQLSPALTPDQIQACRRCWPGPFTLILPAGNDVSPAVTAGKETLAVRVPALAPLQSLLLAVGVPLVSTSANRAGGSPAADLATAAADFGAEVDGIWGTDAEQDGPLLASALVDLTRTPARVLRPGPLAFPGI